jgi:hypothetical protein
MPGRNLCEELDALIGRVKALEARPNSVQTTNVIVLDKELDRILARMETLRATYASHQTWSKEDRELFAKLKARKKEIQALLGVKF